MANKEYSVTVWSKKSNGGGSSDQRWRGENLTEAIIVASYEFVKEIVIIESKAKKLKKIEPWHRIDMSYASKVKCRITVLEEIGDPRHEAAGNLPKVLKSFGNDSVEIFQRAHFD